MLLLLLLTLIFYYKIPGEIRSNNWYLLLPLLYWWLFMMFINHVNIGIRYLLPVYPLLFLLAAQAITCIVREKYRKIRNMFLGAIMLWYIAIAITTYPFYLSYFNELIGGPDQGYKYVIDSNIDWGQDLLRLKRSIGLKNLSHIHVSLYGPEEWLFREYEEITCESTNGWFAVSVNRLVGFRPGLDKCLELLRKINPVDNVGNSILLYYVQ